MSHDHLKELQEQFARQNEMLDAFASSLQSLGDVELAVPNSVLEDLAEITTPPANVNAPAMPTFGIRA